MRHLVFDARFLCFVVHLLDLTDEHVGHVVQRPCHLLEDLASARARGRKGGAPFKMTVANVRLAMAAMGKPKTKVADLCRELGVTRQTLYRHVSPAGNLRKDGRKLLKSKRR